MADAPETPALHGQLLEAIGDLSCRGKEEWFCAFNSEDFDTAIGALRAVVELHIPEFFAGMWACLACSPGMPPPILVLWADCATTAAVASNLGVEVGRS